MSNGFGTACAAAIIALACSGAANAADKIKIGFFATLEGTYTALGEDGQRGFDLALMQHHNKAGGKELEVIRGSSDASPDSALRAAKKLVEQDKVDILIAPLSGSEGIALHDYAKTQPKVHSLTAAPPRLRRLTSIRRRISSASTSTAPRSIRGWASTSTTSSTTIKSRRWPRTIRSPTPRCSASRWIIARSAARSPSDCGYRLAPRILPQSSLSCRMMSMPSISASAALTPSTSSISSSRLAATPSSSAARS